jgi:hypothetical protein
MHRAEAYFNMSWKDYFNEIATKTFPANKEDKLMVDKASWYKYTRSELGQ